MTTTTTTTVTLADLTRMLRESAGEEEGIDLDGDVLDTPFLELGYDSLALLQVIGEIQRDLRHQRPRRRDRRRRDAAVRCSSSSTPARAPRPEPAGGPPRLPDPPPRGRPALLARPAGALPRPHWSPHSPWFLRDLATTGRGSRPTRRYPCR